MSLRVVLTLAVVCAATPLGAAEASDAQTAGQAAAQSAAVQAGPRESDAAPKIAPSAGDAAPRRYSLHREYGETPDPAAFARPQAAAEQELVLAPGFFEPLPPTLAAPPAAAPARDREGRPIQQSDPDDSPQV